MGVLRAHIIRVAAAVIAWQLAFPLALGTAVVCAPIERAAARAAQPSCCPGMSPGAACPMHEQASGEHGNDGEPAWRCSCDNLDAAFLTLLGGAGVLAPIPSAEAPDGTTPLHRHPGSVLRPADAVPPAPPPRA